MRKSLQRAFALAASVPVLAGSLLLAAPAANAAIPLCSGTPITEFDLLGDNHWRLAVYTQGSQTNLCIQAHDNIQTVIVVKSGVNVTPPNVTQTAGVGTCATRVIDMTQPVALALSFGYSTSGPNVCLGTDGETTTIGLNAASVNTIPDVEVWFPANSLFLQFGPCVGYYAQWVATSQYSYYSDWQNCYSYDRQYI